MPLPRSRPIEVRLPPSGVVALESTHSDTFEMAASSHPFVEIFFVLSGRGTFHLDRDEHPAQEGDLIIVPTGVQHRIQDTTGFPLSLYVLCLHPTLASLGGSPSLSAGRIPLSPDQQDTLRLEWRRLLYEQTLPQTGGVALIIGRALQLLGQVLRRQLTATTTTALSGDQRIATYLTNLKQRFFEVGDLDAEASSLGLSRRRFTQLIRQATGHSWHEHLTRLRVDYARHLLLHTRRSVTAIAFECGYDELSSFYRAFKKQTHTTPTALRGQKRSSPPSSP